MEFPIIGIIGFIFLITISISCGQLPCEYVYDLFEIIHQSFYVINRNVLAAKILKVKIAPNKWCGRMYLWRRMDFKTFTSDGDRGKRQKKELGQIA